MTDHGLALIDLDGVLVNWVGGALKLIGRSEDDPDLRDILLSGEHPPFDALFGGRDQLDAVIKQAGKEFWMNLDIFEWAERLVEIVLDSGLKCAFLTSHGSWPEAAGFKLEFLADTWGHIPVFVGKHKGILGNPTSLLIDDFAQNIHSFKLNGGQVFHWPNHLLLKEDATLVNETLEDLRLVLWRMGLLEQRRF